MKTVWLLYILITFNGDPKLEVHEYATQKECEQEKMRVAEEIKQVYDIDNVQLHCILASRYVQ